MVSIQREIPLAGEQGLFTRYHPPYLFVYLYRWNKYPDGEILATAKIGAENTPWELRMVWAPKMGPQFYKILIDLARDHGLMPHQRPGHVVRKASAIWKNLHDSDKIQTRSVSGPHFDDWLNLAYYSKEPGDELVDLQKNHRRWFDCWSLKLSRWFARCFGRKHTYLWLDEICENLRIQADRLLRQVTEIYEKGGDGARAKDTHAARLLVQAFKQQAIFRFEVIKAGRLFYGCAMPLESNNHRLVLSNNKDSAEMMSHGQPAHHLCLAGNQTVLVTDSGPDMRSLLLQCPRIEELKYAHFGSNPYDFLVDNWDVIAFELGDLRIDGFISGPGLYLCC